MTTCEYCLVGKSKRNPFGIGTKVKTALEIIHFDICGHMSVNARHEALYFITFIDDFTR